MKKELFYELQRSVKEGGKILKGKKKPSREFNEGVNKGGGNNGGVRGGDNDGGGGYHLTKKMKKK